MQRGVIADIITGSNSILDSRIAVRFCPKYLCCGILAQDDCREALGLFLHQIVC